MSSARVQHPSTWNLCLRASLSHDITTYSIMRFGIHDLQDHLDSSSDDDDEHHFNASTSFSSSSSNHSSNSGSDEDDDEGGESSFLDDFLGRPGGSSTPNKNLEMKGGRGKRGVSEKQLRRTERRVSSGRYGLNVRRLPSDVERENEAKAKGDDQ